MVLKYCSHSKLHLKCLYIVNFWLFSISALQVYIKLPIKRCLNALQNTPIFNDLITRAVVQLPDYKSLHSITWLQEPLYICLTNTTLVNLPDNQNIGGRRFCIHSTRRCQNHSRRTPVQCDSEKWCPGGWCRWLYCDAGRRVRYCLSHGDSRTRSDIFVNTGGTCTGAPYWCSP